MRGVKNFREFVESGIVRTQSPDKARSKSLIKEAFNSFVNSFNSIKKVIEDL